jgi:predicted transglutaminase-like cysteine proteinase
MNWLQKLFNLDKVEALQKECKVWQEMYQQSLLDIKVLNQAIEKLHSSNPKEDETNNKYPKSDVTYVRQEKDGVYEIDVRNYIDEYDSSIPSLGANNDDDTALNCLVWVINNIKYIPDKTQYGIQEFWAYSYQTLRRKAGDCEDGAILLYNIMLKSGIPYWKIRLTAGNTPYGGHAYVTYYEESQDRWVSLDWCYFPTKLPIKDRVNYKEDKLYGDVWFSWNKKYAFALQGTKLQISHGKK